MSDPHAEQPSGHDLSRRTFLAASAAVSSAAGLGGSAEAASERSSTSAPVGPEPVLVTLSINGRRQSFAIEPRVTLLDALRERAGLTGTKKGCDQGTCGACTVLVNGRRINACLALAIAHERDEITTIEGLARGEELHPMQAAFIEHDGFQCGYCTLGQIVSAVGLIAEKRPTDDASVREFMSGNICRCGAYPNICAAIQAVATRASV